MTTASTTSAGAIDPNRALASRRVALDRPWAWLAAGWSDLARAPSVSLTYGVAFALLGWVITFGLWAMDWLYLTLPLVAGFLIVGPLFAVGLYETSRRLDAGERPSLMAALCAWRRNASQIGLMGIALLLLMFAWVELALIIFMLFFGRTPPAVDQLVQQTFLNPQALPFLIVGTVVGALLAAFAFAISVIAIPLLLDHPRANVFTAIASSIAAVRTNPGPLFFWGALIVLFTGAGLVTLYLGLVVALPLIGHATWHAYVDLVEH
jgi:uncharacterized membrane protein